MRLIFLASVMYLLWRPWNLLAVLLGTSSTVDRWASYLRIARPQRLLDRLKYLARCSLGWRHLLHQIEHPQEQPPVSRIQATWWRLLHRHQDVARQDGEAELGELSGIFLREDAQTIGTMLV